MATTITTSPLPALDSPQIQELRLSEKPSCYNAYNRILRAELNSTPSSSGRRRISFLPESLDTDCLSSTLSLISSAIDPAHHS